MSALATSVPSSRAGHIEDIFDENLLREMWMEASDNESKRQIRSRMYKLREERLKNFYNREAILENILKTEDSTSDVPAQDDTLAPSTTSLIEDGLLTEETDLQSQVIRKDRTRQFTEIKGSGSGLQVITESSAEAGVKRSVTSVTTTKSKNTLGSGNSPPPVVRETIVRNGKTQSGATVVKTSSRRTDAQTQRKVTHSATTQKSSSTHSTNSNHFQEETKVGRSALTHTTNSNHSQEETKVGRSALTHARMSPTPPPTKKVSKGMLSPPTVQRVTATTAQLGLTADPNPPTTPKSLPRFMASTKSRDLGLGALPPTGTRGPAHAAKKEPSPVRSLSPDVKVSNANGGGTRKKPAHPAMNGNSSTAEKKHTSTTVGQRKEKVSSQLSGSRESSLSPSRRPTLKEMEGNETVRTTEIMKRRQTSPASKVIPKDKMKAKTKAEESIIRELDNLDSFLLQRSESPDGKGKDTKPVVFVDTPDESKLRSSTTANTNKKREPKVGKPKAATKDVNTEAGLIDVMEAGLEPVVTRTTYKYGCTEPEKPKVPMKKKSSLEEEIILDAASKSPRRDSSTSPSRKLGRSQSKEKAVKSTQATECRAAASKTSKSTFETTVMTGVGENSVILTRPNMDLVQRAPHPDLRRAAKLKKPEVKDLERWGDPNPVHRIVKKAGVKYEEHSDEDEDPRVPPKRFGGPGKGLESPGVVQMAKSLFENKASEAAMDKSSTIFLHGGPGFNVNKHAALFEARVRGLDEDGCVFSEPCLLPEPMADTPNRPYPNNVDDYPDASPCHSFSNVDSETTTISQLESAQELTMTQSAPVTRIKSTEEIPPELDPKGCNVSPKAPKKNAVRSRSNSVLLDARVEALVNRSTKASHLPREEKKSDQPDLRHIDDIKDLNRLLETAANYDERLAIRTRIRCLARETSRTESSVERLTSSSTGSQKKPSTIAPGFSSNMAPTGSSVKVPGADMVNKDFPKSYVSRKSSKEVPKPSQTVESEDQSNRKLKPQEAELPDPKRNSVEDGLKDSAGTNTVVELPERTKSSPTKKSVKAVAQKFESVASRKEAVELKPASVPTPARSVVQNQMKKFQLNLNQENKSSKGAPVVDKAPSPEPRKIATGTKPKEGVLTEGRKSPEGNSKIGKSEVGRKDRKSPETGSKNVDDSKTQSRSTGLYSTRKTSKELRASEELEFKTNEDAVKKCDKKARDSPSPTLPKPAADLEADSKVGSEVTPEPKKAYSRRRSSSPFVSKTKTADTSAESAVSDPVAETKAKKPAKSRRSSTPTLPKTNESEEPQATPKVDESSKGKQKSGRKTKEVDSPKGTIELKQDSRKLVESDIICNNATDSSDMNQLKEEARLVISTKVSSRETNLRNDSNATKLDEATTKRESKSKDETTKPAWVDPSSSPETKAKRPQYTRRSVSKEVKQEDVPKKELVKTSTDAQQGSKNSTSYGRYEVAKKTLKTVQVTQDATHRVRDQGMEVITSSYGVGPMDDDGTPLFGLKALKKIKQSQENRAYAALGNMEDTVTENAGMDINMTDESDQGRRNSLRGNDNYGLRALRKNSGTATTMLTSSFPDSLDQKSETTISCLSATTEERPPVSTSPKSILKKTSSFSSNKSGSRNEVDPFGANEEKASMTSSSTTRIELTTSMPHLSQEKTQSDYQDWEKGGLEFGNSTTGLARGHVGGSSVREMSRKFETQDPASTSTTVETRTTISSIRSNYESDGSEDLGTTDLVPAGSGRSFLNDRTPVTGVADVMDRMRWKSETEDEGTEGRSLLNKFLGAQVLMQGIEPMLSRGNEGTSTTSGKMSKSLVIKGIDIDEELDCEKLRDLLDDCDLADDKGRIETRLKTLGASGMSVSKKSTRSADVTGELMPFILGQLQSSLESIGGGGGGVSRSSSGPGHSPNTSGSTPHTGPPEGVTVGSGSSGRSGLLSSTNPNQSSSSTSTSNTTGGAEESAGSAEECLFDSGTESGEDGPSAVVVKKKSPPPAEFSSFMEGLRHSLTRDGLDFREALAIPATQTPAGTSRADSDLVQQVDQVLSLLRDSLLKDPNCLVQTLKTAADPNKGKELIALIDRLKSSLNSSSPAGGSAKESKAPLPVMVGSEEGPSSWSDPRPPDLAPVAGPSKATHPWALRIKPYTAAGTVERRDSAPTWPPAGTQTEEEVPWKIRAVKKRATRSRSIGVSEEELAEARRFLEEEAFRSALKTNHAQPPRPAPSASIKPFSLLAQTWRPDVEKQLNSVPRPYVRSESLMESRDDSALLHTRLKPFRTFSLDNPHDPSQSFFTPEEVVQIAIHKAAINKQMSDEEERRRRRNSLSAAQMRDMAQTAQTPRDLSVGLPKPYSAPSHVSIPSSSMSSSDESRQTVRRRSSGSSCSADQLMLYPNPNGTGTVSSATTALQSPQRIENVQISLKELNSSSEFPQLQIAITLNTNNPSGSGSSSSSDKALNLKKVESGDGGSVVQPSTKSGSSEDTDRSSSSKANRYKSKSERKKKMKRANTIDLPQQPNEEPEGDDEEESDGSVTQHNPPPPKNEGARKFEAFMEKNAGRGKSNPPPPAYLNVNDKFWNSRFSNLKTSFESSSQGSSPSVSPVPLSPGKPRSVFVDMSLQAQAREGPPKPVWAQATQESSGHQPSSVKNKLSVFESKVAVHPIPEVVSHKTSISDMWNPQGSDYVNQAPQQPPKPFKSSILSKKESFEKKFAEESRAAAVVKPKPIQMKVFEQQVQQQDRTPQQTQAPPLPPKKQTQPIYEGVHMVHATKSALEAMQKPSFVPAPHVPPRGMPPPRPIQPPADPLPWTKAEEVPQPQSRVPQGLTSGVRISKAIFESKKIPSNSPPPPIPPRFSASFGEDVSPFIAGKRNEFENFQKFRGHPPLEPQVPRTVGVAQPSPKPKLSVFGVARSFDETFKQKLEATAPRVHFGSTASIPKPEGISSGTKSAFARQVSNSAPSSRRHSENEEEPSNVMSPVMSKVMRGPQQQRATVTRREMSSLGEDHPSAHRIRSAAAGSLHQSASLDSDSPPGPKFSGFPPQPRSLQLPAQGIVKSHSGDSLLQAHLQKQHQHHHQLPTTSQSFNRAPPPIPRQKSLSDFPREPAKVIPAAYQTLGSNAGVSVSSPSIVSPNSDPQYPKTFLPSNETLKRTSSGSSIFDRAKSLFISTQDAAGVRPQLQQQRRGPPALPRSSGLFPKQYEAQMSPDSVGKKTRAVESYFKFPGQSEGPVEPKAAPRGRYARGGRKDENYHNKIRKSASQGTIVNRQRSFSDPDEEEEDVDSIFESLFKASVESKSAKAIAGGSMTSAEKLVASQIQSKQVDQSVKTSATGTSASMSMQKSSKSSSSFSSSSTASSSSTTLESSGSPFSKFKQLDNQNSKKTDVGGKPIFKFTNPAIKASANSAKDMLLYWAQCRTRDYQNVNLENFSSSWSDGLAFCALIHNFFPDAFDYQKLDPKNRRSNFDLAFKIADEKAGIYPLLDTEDMIAMGRRPDWKCVFTYVQSMYQKLKDL